MVRPFPDQSGKLIISFIFGFFALLLLIFLIPKKYPSSSSFLSTATSLNYDLSSWSGGGCISFLNVDSRVIQARTTFDKKINGRHGASVKASPPRDYKLIIKNVPISMKLEEVEDKGINEGGYDKIGFDPDISDVRSVDGKFYQVMYPQTSHPIPLILRNMDVSNGSNKILVADYGLIVLAHLDDNKKPIRINVQGFNAPVVLTDVYQAVDIFRTKPLPQVAVDECQGRNSQYYSPVPQPVITQPTSEYAVPNEKSESDGSQVQLDWFLIHQSPGKVTSVEPSGEGAVGAWITHCKPAVYLYPPNPMLINVKVYPSGFLTYTDPIYDIKTGWNIQAFPDGTLIDIKNQSMISYPYLYFESKVYDKVVQKPEKGWVVQYNQLENLYNQVLPKLGLNSKQTIDFIEYWKKALPYSAYYFVGVIEKENVDKIEKLKITPKPDSINRVRIYFEKLDAPKVVQAPDLQTSTLNPSSSSSFSVIEWGGMVKQDKDHPFTCSQ